MLFTLSLQTKILAQTEGARTQNSGEGYFLAPLFLLNYILFNLFLFFQKSGGTKAPPPLRSPCEVLLGISQLRSTFVGGSDLFPFVFIQNIKVILSLKGFFCSHKHLV